MGFFRFKALLLYGGRNFFHALLEDYELPERTNLLVVVVEVAHPGAEANRHPHSEVLTLAYPVRDGSILLPFALFGAPTGHQRSVT